MSASAPERTRPPIGVTVPERTRPPIGVTVLSGFLGAGKTCVLKNILEKKDIGARVAVIVNDMASVNIDAKAVDKIVTGGSGGLNKMVAMENGCICCTLNEDLLKQIAELSDVGSAPGCSEKPFDYLVIESTGIAVPLPIAQTFIMDVACDKEGKALPFGTDLSNPASNYAGHMKNPLTKYARLDCLVTVVDAPCFFDRMSELTRVRDQPEAKDLGIAAAAGNAGEIGERVSDELNQKILSEVQVDQVETADVILINKVDVLLKQGAAGEKELRAVEALVRKLNPEARLYRTEYGRVGNLSQIMDTKLFDLNKQMNSAGWIRELENRGKREVEAEIANEKAAMALQLTDEEEAEIAKLPPCCGGRKREELLEKRKKEMAAAEKGDESEGPSSKKMKISAIDEEDEGKAFQTWHGISSIVFRANKPFHPTRLRKILAGFAAVDLSAWGGKTWEGDLDVMAEKGDKAGVDAAAFRGVIRSKGTVWLANAHSHALEWHSAGRTFELKPVENPYIARVMETHLGVKESMNKENPGKPLDFLGQSKLSNTRILKKASELFDQEEIDASDPSGQTIKVVQSDEVGEITRLIKDDCWTRHYGDRQQELVLIGAHLDKPRMRAALDGALLTEEEMAAGPKVWREYTDCFFGGALPKQCWDIDLNMFVTGDDDEEMDDDDESDEDEEEMGDGGETAADSSLDDAKMSD